MHVPHCAILVVDDHPLIRLGLRALLSKDPRLAVCGEAAGAQEGLQLARQLRPHVAIIDISLEDGNGLQLVRELRTHCPKTRSIVVSRHDTRLFARRAFEAGAHGFINKRDAIGRIVEAIHTVREGEFFVLFNPDTPDDGDAVGPEGPALNLEALSDLELEIFDLLGNGLTIPEIAERIHHTLDTITEHRDNIRLKLGLPSANELVRSAIVHALSN